MGLELMKSGGERVVRWEVGRQRKVLSFLPFPLLFHHHASGSSSSHPFLFILLVSDFIVPSFLCFSLLLLTLYPFPPYILLLPSPFLSVHALLVISLNIVPPPSKKRESREVEAFGSMQDPFIVLLKGIKGKPGSTDPTSQVVQLGLNTGELHCILWEQEHVVCLAL